MTYDPWIHIAGGLPVWACLGTQPCVRLSGEFAMCTDNGEASAMGPGPGAATSSKLSYRSLNTKIVKIPTTSTECRMQSHFFFHPIIIQESPFDAVAPCLTNFQKMQSHLAFGRPMWPGRIGSGWAKRFCVTFTEWPAGLGCSTCINQEEELLCLLGRHRQKVQQRRAQQKIRTQHNSTKCK